MLTPSRVLITGASGFVGKHLAEKCRRCYPDARLYGIYRSLEIADADEIFPLIADVKSFQSIHEAIAQSRPDLIFHLAAQSSVVESWKNPIETLRVNAEGLLHLLEALRQEELQPRVIVIGSSEQYGMIASTENPIKEECPFRPISPYGASKATQDFYAFQYFVAYHFPIIRVRPFNHFGPRQMPTSVVASIARQIAMVEAGKKEAILHIGNVHARRDFLPVQDVVSAYIAIAEHGHPGEAYNVGSGRSYAIGEIVELLLRHTKSPITVQEDVTYIREMDHLHLLADTTRLRAHTGWEPILDIECALAQTLEYWRFRV
jgi:GDP-4-dehydro-6-deoxy-D-mannose reductase